MKDYVILTDSCCDLSAGMAEELELHVLPLSFVMEEKEYFNHLDYRDISAKDFYARVRGGALGTTSAINVAVFTEAMTELVGQGKDVLCIAFSSGLSTTYQSAAIAAGEVMNAHPGSKVLVCDSRAASLGQGLLVYLAVQEKRNRVSAAAALFGTMLQMKPVLHVDGEGHLIPVSKVRGRKASVNALLEKMDELVDDPSVVFISHGDCEDEAVALGEAIKAKYKVDKLVINYVGPVIGNHSGPGTLALFFQGKHK